jgi:hypothetical protein
MTSYTVHVVCKHHTRQLLLIQGLGDTPISLAVYDEHTGTTLMRMTEPTLDELKRAISILAEE